MTAAESDIPSMTVESESNILPMIAESDIQPMTAAESDILPIVAKSDTLPMTTAEFDVLSMTTESDTLSMITEFDVNNEPEGDANYWNLAEEMMFDSLEEAEATIYQWAMIKGFGIRCSHSNKNISMYVLLLVSYRLV